MRRAAPVPALEILRCASAIGVASVKIHDEGGASSIGHCYPGIAPDLLAEIGGELPAFVPLWRELVRACGMDDGLEGLFLPVVLCFVIDQISCRVRYSPQARVPALTGGRRMGREIDILIA